jgi:hypothetical protein
LNKVQVAGNNRYDEARLVKMGCDISDFENQNRSGIFG